MKCRSNQLLAIISIISMLSVSTINVAIADAPAQCSAVCGHDDGEYDCQSCLKEHTNKPTESPYGMGGG